jgi:hypothetical protein
MSRHLEFRRTMLDSIAQAKKSAMPALTASKHLYALTLIITVVGFFHLGVEWKGPIFAFNAINLFFATAITSLVGSATTLGQPVPLTLRGLVGERQFWVYVYALFIYWALPGFAAMLGLVLGLALYLTGIDPTAFETNDGWMTATAFSSIPAVLISAYVTARLSLLLPAIAAGEQLSISAAWKRSTGNVFKIAAAFMIAVGVFFIFQQLIVEMAKLASATFIALVASLAIIFVTFCQALLNGTVAGSIYRQLHGSVDIN